MLFPPPSSGKEKQSINKISFELPQEFLESDFNSLHAWITLFHIFQYKFHKIW